MSSIEAIKELYIRAQEINFDDTPSLDAMAETKEEEDFYRMVADFILQQKQKKAIKENRF